MARSSDMKKKDSSRHARGKKNKKVKKKKKKAAMSATRKKSGGLKKSAPIETRSNDPRIQYAEELAAEAFDNKGSEARLEVNKRSRDRHSSGLTTKSEGDVAWNSSTSVRDGAWDMQGRLDEIANWSAALGPMSYNESSTWTSSLHLYFFTKPRLLEGGAQDQKAKP